MGKPSRRREADNTRDVSDSTPPEQEVVRKFSSVEERTPKEPTLQDVMHAITASRTALKEKIDSLASDFSVLRDDHRRLAERVTSAEKGFGARDSRRFQNVTTNGEKNKGFGAEGGRC
ncbi:hypothetical protein NDU88_003865 [Pleurodeles waltl]|uniref:Uncharacterized protein n=1 Tax=Pleurodeles waltl TaxID=8319 RepID=A0AAV7UEV9_PLEWA|nr:hypothetical protein NDU88_003865 [Pleurodeles waltl]